MSKQLKSKFLFTISMQNHSLGLPLSLHRKRLRKARHRGPSLQVVSPTSSVQSPHTLDIPVSPLTCKHGRKVHPSCPCMSYPFPLHSDLTSQMGLRMLTHLLLSVCPCISDASPTPTHISPCLLPTARPIDWLPPACGTSIHVISSSCPPETNSQGCAHCHPHMTSTGSFHLCVSVLLTSSKDMSGPSTEP